MPEYTLGKGMFIVRQTDLFDIFADVLAVECPRHGNTVADGKLRDAGSERFYAT